MKSAPPRLSTLLTLESSLVGFLVGCLLIGLGAGFWFFQRYDGRFYQGVSVDGHDLSGLTIAEARAQLGERTTLPEEFTVTLQVDDIAVSSSSAELGVRRTYTKALDQAYALGRQGSLIRRVRDIFRTRVEPVAFESQLVYQEIAIKTLISELAQRVNLEGVEPTATLTYSNSPQSLVINPGKPGRAIKELEALELLIATQRTVDTRLEVPVASTAAQLTDSEITAARERAQKLVGQEIIFTAEQENLSRTLKDQQLIPFLAFPQGYNDSLIETTVATWAATLNRPAQDAEFEYDPDTLQVTTFVPHRNGLTLNQADTIDRLLARLKEQENGPSNQSNIEEKIPFTFTTTEPLVTLASTNTLGIQEVIGFGESEYDHSIPTRIHNVAHTTKKINLTLVPPGAEFSFNKTLGEVSRATGFQPAYVIKNGRTELGDGGGVCQVSTTLFRAILNAGLPITKRRQHSYRVSYYELNAKPGIDATVYAGEVDLRFKNDTGHHVLLYAEADSDDLYMKVELYGTSDGRTAEIVDHEVWGFRPAPPPVYIPDPALPPGAKKQVDWAVGGVKARFKNVVKDKDGNVIREEEYYSNYVPWSAKFLVGV